MRRALPLAIVLALGLGLAACGGEEPEDDPVEAMEQNVTELGGVRYRIVLFRELNPRIRPDRAIYDGPPPEEGVGIFAAFLEACNATDEVQVPTDRVRLEDAFGEAYPQVEPRSGDPLAYAPRPLRPDRCLPAQDAVAERALPGAAVLFEVPFDALSNRPFVLELRGSEPDSADEVRRVQLDL
jgi:hypothetical protein